MGPLNQLLQNNISLFDPLELSPIQKNNKLPEANIQRTSKPLNKKWIATGAVLALTSVASALAVGYRYFEEKNNIIPPEPTLDPIKITFNTIIDLAVLAGMAYLAKTIIFKDTIVTKNETPFSKQSGNIDSLSEPVEDQDGKAITILENFNKAESCKTDEAPFLEECEKVNEYLKELYSPNDDQKLLIQTFVTSLKTTVNASNASGYLLKNFPEILENTYDILLDIDQNSAFEILKTCINIEKCPFAWQCGVFIEKTLQAINTDDRLILFLAEKFNQKSITIDEFNTVIKYLNKSSLPVLDANLKSLFQAFTDFLLEKIHNPEEENHEQLSLTLKSVFDLLLYKFTDDDSALTIAKSCINLSSDASENLKKQCEFIIKTVLQHNTGIALKLVKHCAEIINESNQKNIQQYLTWFLEAENYRLNHSFNNHMKEVVAKIYDQRPKQDTFEIKSTLFLCSFLRFSSGIKNPILQNCIVNAFEAIIQQDLKKYHNYNSEILECTFKFLTHENMPNYDTNENMPNYELALSLLKIYISSKASNSPEFIKGAYEKLLIESPETAKELAQYCQDNSGVRGLVNYIKDDNGSEQDDTQNSIIK